MRARGLASEVKALRTERSNLVAAIDDARAQTDRVIAYAAERDRAVERLEAELAEIEARRALPRRSHRARPSAWAGIPALGFLQADLA